MSGRYRPRAHFYVEAFRFEGQPRDQWPKWLADRTDLEIFFGGPAPGTIARVVIRGSTIGALNVRRESWVVRHYGGRIGVFTDEAFNASYEPVETAA